MVSAGVGLDGPGSDRSPGQKSAPRGVVSSWDPAVVWLWWSDGALGGGRTRCSPSSSPGARIGLRLETLLPPVPGVVEGGRCLRCLGSSLGRLGLPARLGLTMTIFAVIGSPLGARSALNVCMKRWLQIDAWRQTGCEAEGTKGRQLSSRSSAARGRNCRPGRSLRRDEGRKPRRRVIDRSHPRKMAHSPRRHHQYFDITIIIPCRNEAWSLEIPCSRNWSFGIVGRNRSTVDCDSTDHMRESGCLVSVGPHAGQRSGYGG